MNTYAQDQKLIAYSAAEKTPIVAKSSSLEKYVKSGGRFLPLQVDIEKAHLRVSNYLGAENIKEGADIIKLNGAYVPQIIYEMLPMFPASSVEFQEAALANYFSFALWSVYGWGNEVVVTYKNPGDDKVNEVKLSGVDINTLLD